MFTIVREKRGVRDEKQEERRKGGVTSLCK